MHFSSSFVIAAVPFLVSAAPLKRQASATDILVLNFANALEQLETQFYTQALATFQESDFTAAGFTSAAVAIEQITSIMTDEATHASALAEIIPAVGGQVGANCTFDFSSVLTDVTTMASAARVIEMTGVGAYLGAASLISDPQILTTAASILTVEARHQTVLNILSGTGTAIPQAFDIPLTPSQVLAIASPFISGCDLGVPANPPLTVTTTGTITTGTSLTFSSTGIQGLDSSTLSCQMMIGGAPFAISLPLSSCVVPPMINGPVAIYITNTTQPLANDVTVQFGGSVVAGPTLAFIDINPQTLPALARSSNVTVDSSSTISPDEASSIMASATATDSVASATADAASATVTDDSSPTDSAAADSSTDSATADSSTDSAAATGTDSVTDIPAATGTASAAAASGTSTPDNVSSTNDDQVIGGPNLYTGPSSDGNTDVLGWSNLPAGTPPS